MIRPRTKQTSALNREFRRVDWRFLTSAPQPQKSVCFTGGLLAKSVAGISGHTIDGHFASADDCDLAVAVNPDRSTLQAAHAALRTGGVCYTEWTAWRKGGAQGIQDQLQKAGFSRVHLYWPYPACVRPRLWLPLFAHRAPYRYLARRVTGKLFKDDTLISRAVQAVLPVLLHLVLRAGFLPHLSAVAYKNVPQTPDVFEFVRGEWSRLYPKSSTDQLSYIVEMGGSQSINKIVCLVFASSNPCPQWVIKLPRMPADAQTLQQGREILKNLHLADSDKSGVIRVPRMVFACKLNGVWMSGEEALDGIPLKKYLRPDNLRAIALKLIDWQVALAKQSWSGSRTVTSQQAIELLTADLDILAGKGLQPEELAQTRSILMKIKSDTIPLVCTHNDFIIHNMVWMTDGIGVFDWTDSDWDGLPMLDLVYALSTLFFTLEGAWNVSSRLATYHRLLNPRTQFGSVFNDCLVSYAEQLGLRLGHIAPLRLLTWILHRNFEYQNHKLEFGAQAQPGHVHQSRILSLWKAELHWQQLNN